MKRKSSPLLKLVLFLVTVALCVAVIAIAGLLLVIPVQAEKVFGPPSPELDTIDRLYLASLLLIHENELTTPLDPFGAPQTFQVQFGEATALVIQRLHALGLIADPTTFRNYLQYSGLDTGIQAGEYSLSASLSPIEIAYAIQDATPTQVTFNILPGWRLEEIAQALPTSGLSITPEVFLEISSKPAEGYLFSASMPPDASLEGFLFPGSYSFERTIDIELFIRTFLTTFESSLTQDLQQGFDRQGLNTYQAVTLASIVQRESVLEEEMPLITSVFYNRLRAGIKLDADTTVQYALGYNPAQNTWWTNPLSMPDLSFDSPYNTYIYPGLPPGPISNPGLKALNSVAFPAQSPYYYFRADCDGSGRHQFSESFDEHVQKACP
ncbi:MAG TPA: endolytic transglycosylase MltG [Anaerolineales bacterium]|nr:endolytic transglycosylase MltG [Anaerolineales bacterium]